MPRTLRLELSGEQRAELERVRDTHKLPYVREKAAALVKIADGQTGSEVARHGLLRRRDTDTIYRWVERYRTKGIAGLGIGKGRGRKASFSP